MTDSLAIVRMLGALLTVLGLLAGALWAVRRWNLVLPGSGRTAATRRLQVVERLSLDPRRSLALVRRDGCEHLILLAPEGPLLVEGNIMPPAPQKPVAAPLAPQPAPLAALVNGFGALVDRARQPIGAAAPVHSRAPTRATTRRKAGVRHA